MVNRCGEIALMYPKAKYHPSESHRVVADEAEEEALGKGWHDSPNFPVNPPPPDGPEPEEEELEPVSIAEKRGPGRPRKVVAE